MWEADADPAGAEEKTKEQRNGGVQKPSRSNLFKESKGRIKPPQQRLMFDEEKGIRVTRPDKRGRAQKP